MEENVANIQQDIPQSSTRKAIAVCGCGNDGRLGLGTCDSQNRITLIPFFLSDSISSDNNNNINEKNKKNDNDGNFPGIIQSLRVGGYHNFVITTTGVYGWGLNENGQLGLGRGAPACVLQPTRIPFFDKHPVLDISCGAYHTFAWTVDGLFACGKNDEGQLGLSTDSDYMEFTMVLNAAQINRNKEGNDNSNNNTTIGESVGECRLIKRAQLTHLSCGTHHTLLAFRNVEVIEKEEKEKEEETKGTTYEKESVRHLPLLIVATGKGDFGELGYDGDTWSILQAKAKRMQSALQVEVQHQQQKGYENNTVSDLPELIEKKWKPLKQRRAAFSSTRFQPVALPMVVEYSTMSSSVYPLEIVSLHAMHLHSAVVFRDISTGKDNNNNNNNNIDVDVNTGRIRTFHWGCYYCNAVEDDASSIPREEEKGNVCLHAGNETIFRYPINPTSNYEVEVMGSGILGLGEEESFETRWVSLPLPHPAKDFPVRIIDGREHYLILLENKMVLGFGDNMHGQLALDDTIDVVLSPTTVIQVGDQLKCPPLPYSSSNTTTTTNSISEDTLWTVESICDVACGLRHSVFVVEVRPSA